MPSTARFCPALLACLASLAPAAAQETPPLVATPVAEGVYMIEGRGGNIGVCAGPDGTFVIDDQYAPLDARITAAIAEVTSEPVRFVFNTHWHPDHTGGNEALGESGAVIVAHENVRRRLTKGQLIKAFLRQVPPAPHAALPVVTFTDAITFHLNGQTIQVTHVDPAHTDGDSLIKFEEANVLHTGDVFFNGFYPFIDESSGGSLAGMVRAANQALELCDDETRIIPGHGPLATRSDLVAYRDMLQTVLGRLQALYAEGKDLAAIVAAKPTREFDAEWGDGFLKPDFWVRIVAPTVAPQTTPKSD
jgi:glyoxylase-like metal-dependent hydrolase (beta-lactamase superfamily II)